MEHATVMQMLLTAPTGKIDVEIGIIAGKMRSHSFQNYEYLEPKLHQGKQLSNPNR
jgi:hypothetical protein